VARLVTCEWARRGEWRDVPTGQLRTTYFLESPQGTDLPQCFRVENTPHRRLDTHFHEADQFQVITAGTGTLGRHPLMPFSVHFARAFTPYGPIVAGPQGLDWLSIRAIHDDGAQYMPESREALLAVKDRQPWQITQAVSFDDVPTDGTLYALPGLSDERGLGAFAVQLQPGAAVTLPDPSATGGQFLVAVRGGVTQDGHDTASLGIMLIRPTEPQTTVVAGAQGLAALVLNFPVPTRSRVPASPSTIIAPTTATKAWHCGPCGFIYEESEGLPEDGIPPGTRFQDLSIDWKCPDCSASKADFVEVDF
jgi:rubredoxin